ncbi:hypothetical protein L596_006147 [Steinernema carpocapsae]|uniref:Uncharacterized protein n=1 Tax=Steinernema carpocapsae TaxID=34508 RepID=A0A4U8V2T4_STECR|nr:hypothetical protein L596_006147 [Steinernema carpocapsae]
MWSTTVYATKSSIRDLTAGPSSKRCAQLTTLFDSQNAKKLEIGLARTIAKTMIELPGPLFDVDTVVLHIEQKQTKKRFVLILKTYTPHFRNARKEH